MLLGCTIGFTYNTLMRARILDLQYSLTVIKVSTSIHSNVI